MITCSISTGYCHGHSELLNMHNCRRAGKQVAAKQQGSVCAAEQPCLRRWWQWSTLGGGWLLLAGLEL